MKLPQKDRLLGFAAALCFPRRCRYCGRVVGFAPGCGACEKELPKTLLSLEEKILFLRSTECPCLSGLAVKWKYEGPIRRGIARLKFGGEYPLGELYGAELIEPAAALFGQVRFDLVVPVPAAQESLKERGCNVAALLAAPLAKRFGAELSDCIGREFETRAQHKLSRKERKVNLLGVFTAPEAVAGKTVLLVDDVITTGSTMEECARALLLAGAKRVYGAVYAAAMPPKEEKKKENDRWH